MALILSFLNFLNNLNNKLSFSYYRFLKKHILFLEKDDFFYLSNDIVFKNLNYNKMGNKNDKN